MECQALDIAKGTEGPIHLIFFVVLIQPIAAQIVCVILLHLGVRFPILASLLYPLHLLLIILVILPSAIIRFAHPLRRLLRLLELLLRICKVQACQGADPGDLLVRAEVCAGWVSCGFAPRDPLDR